MKNKYYKSLAFWTMGEKYLNLAEGISDQIISSRNRYMIVSREDISWEKYEIKTKWNDVNMAIPLLFNFYHGLELMLKGFILFSEKSGSQLDHRITKLYKKFVAGYADQKQLILLFARYIDKSEMPELLRDFVTHNRLSVDQFYESLRYPYNKNLTSEYQHLVLKYRGPKGLQFYRDLRKDIRSTMKLIVALSRLLEK